jgi:hypothetical protein
MTRSKPTARTSYLEAYEIASGQGRDVLEEEYREQWGEDPASDDQLASHVAALTVHEHPDAAKAAVLDVLAGRPANPPAE